MKGPSKTGSLQTSRLIGEIAAKFALSTAFVNTYFDSQQGFKDKCDQSYETFRSGLNPLQQMYVDFALSTTMRGREIQALVSPQVPLREGRRYLDVGCGYGGFLRAFAEAGFETVGIEIRANLAELSRANVADVSNAAVIEGDFLAQTPGALGSFDCITCNDVIEHVKDPIAAMRAIAAMLRPGGVLFMEIPNRDFIGFVAKDGHYQLFGITPLSREEAGRYYEALVFPNTRIAYDDSMGDYLPLELYRNVLAEEGLACTLIERHVGGTTESLHVLLADLAQAHRQWVDDVKPKLNALLAREIETSFARYASELYDNVAALHRSADVAAFRRRYLLSFWSLLCRRQS